MEPSSKTPVEGGPFIVVFFEHENFEGNYQEVVIRYEEDYAHFNTPPFSSGVWHQTDLFLKWGDSPNGSNYIGSAMVLSGFWDLLEGDHYKSDNNHVIHRNGGPSKDGRYPNFKAWGGINNGVMSLRVYRSFGDDPSLY